MDSKITPLGIEKLKLKRRHIDIARKNAPTEHWTKG